MSKKHKMPSNQDDRTTQDKSKKEATFSVLHLTLHATSSSSSFLPRPPHSSLSLIFFPTHLQTHHPYFLSLIFCEQPRSTPQNLSKTPSSPLLACESGEGNPKVGVKLISGEFILPNSRLKLAALREVRSVGSELTQVAGLAQTLVSVQQVHQKHVVFDYGLDHHTQVLVSEEQVEKGYEQMQLERTPSRCIDQDQSNKSKSKNKLSKKIRDALKKKLQAHNREIQESPTLMLDERNNSSPSKSLDNHNITTESQKSKIPSQQSKCSSQQSNQYITEQCSPIKNPLFENVQEGLNISPLKRIHYKEGMNKNSVDINFVLVTEQAGLPVPPLQVHESPPRE
ncbi:hypothetical protein HAX54_035521 [Datura stramonium]|uniref:Uncharacterized protein n=1 Tax=Datura stramonium TaxID=4076 RepID=A0ABS8SFE1_DATST|nr:hypothetical protein [Datura stramonium]